MNRRKIYQKNGHGVRRWPSELAILTNKKATGGCAVASDYVISRNLSGNRRNPRINSTITAKTGSAGECWDDLIDVFHELRLLFLGYISNKILSCQYLDVKDSEKLTF